jgi:hypothetical protein
MPGANEVTLRRGSMRGTLVRGVLVGVPRVEVGRLSHEGGMRRRKMHYVAAANSP